MSKARIKNKHREILTWIHKGHNPRTSEKFEIWCFGIVDKRQTDTFEKRWIRDPFYHISVGRCPAPIKGAICRCCKRKSPPTFWWTEERN